MPFLFFYQHLILTVQAGVVLGWVTLTLNPYSNKYFLMWLLTQNAPLNIEDMRRDFTREFPYVLLMRRVVVRWGKHCGCFGMILSKNYKTYLPINASFFNRTKIFWLGPNNFGQDQKLLFFLLGVKFAFYQIISARIWGFFREVFYTKNSLLVNFIIQQLKSKHIKLK